MPRSAVWIALPPYVAPPGLAAAGDGSVGAYALVDGALWRIDARRGRVLDRYGLDVQAIGWPAALASGGHGTLYVIGQPASGWAAEAEALAPGPGRGLRVRWRAKLGLTHAGAWIGAAGHGLVAAYMPDAHDMSGTMLLLDAQTGALRGSYALPAPPLAADPAANRLYLVADGALRAFTLRSGRPVASTPGTGPLAVDAPRGIVAFSRPDGLVLAAAATLRPIARLAMRGATALAATPDGATLLVARPGGLAWLAICQ